MLVVIEGIIVVAVLVGVGVVVGCMFSPSIREFVTKPFK